MSALAQAACQKWQVKVVIALRQQTFCSARLLLVFLLCVITIKK
jgi:hypothetical protein